MARSKAASRPRLRRPRRWTRPWRRILGARHLQVLQRLQRPARHGHLGADDIERRACPGALRGRFGDGGERGRACGDGLVTEGGGLAGAAHAGVEVELGEAGLGVGRDHRGGLLHRLGRRKVLPRVRAEMVAAEDQAVARGTRSARRSPPRRRGTGRRHAGIAALVVHLVAGGLDQHVGAPGVAVPQRGLDHQRMRRADRGDAGALAGPAPARQVRQPIRSRHAAPRAARKASTSARVGDPLHRTLAGDRERAAGIGEAQRLPRRGAAQPAADEAAPKQSPAPVGSTSIDGEAGQPRCGRAIEMARRPPFPS